MNERLPEFTCQKAPTFSSVFEPFLWDFQTFLAHGRGFVPDGELVRSERTYWRKLRMGAAVDTNPVSVIAAAHLTQDELEYLRATKLLGVRPRDVPEFLRWTHAKTERVRSRLSKRLMRIRQEPAPDLPVRAEPDVGRGSSLHTTFIDRLGSGRKIYALTGSKRVGFPDLSLVERQSSRTGAPMAEDLQVTLHDERARFDKAVVNLNPA